MFYRLKLSVIIVLLLCVSNSSFAKIYFQYDAEDYPCDDSNLPIPPFWTSAVSYRGHVSCSQSPQGDKHIEFSTKDNQSTAYTELNKTFEGNAISVNNFDR